MKYKFTCVLSILITLLFVNTQLFSAEQIDHRDKLVIRDATKWVEQIFYVINTSLKDETLKIELKNKKSQFISEIAKDFKNRLKVDTLPMVARWCKVSQNRKLLTHISKSMNVKAVTHFIKSNGLNKISANKLKIIKRIRDAYNRGDIPHAFSTYFLLAVVRAGQDFGLASKTTEIPPGRFFPLTTDEKKDYLVTLVKFRYNGYLALAYAFADVPLKDIERFVLFLESKAGINWLSSSFYSNLFAIRRGTELMYQLCWKEYFLKKLQKR